MQAIQPDYSATTICSPPSGLVTHCSAFGLHIATELPLPEFTPVYGTCVPVDAEVTFGSGDDWIAAIRHLPSSWKVDSKEALFWFRGVAGFRVIDGRKIIVSPEPGIDHSLLRMYVEGMMIATLLFQRGFFVLHSSVVRIGSFAIALLGHVGAGKSSTAAALHARGHAVVSDDNAAIELRAPQPEVTPAFPFLKVFPAIAESLGFAKDTLTQMHVSQPKSVHPVSDLFPDQPLPLDRIYVLTREPISGIERVSAPDAIIEIVCNSVPTRWKLPGGAAHLKTCASLAARVPVYRIRTFDTLPELPQLAARIEQHCAQRI